MSTSNAKAPMTIEEMDPSIADGFRVFYDREVPIELRIQDEPDGADRIGTLEAIKVKVLILGNGTVPQGVRIELSSEADLFFHYMHVVDGSTFAAMQEQQHLTLDFADYPAVLVRMLNQCIREPYSRMAIFVMQNGRNAILDFIQNMECKFVELMSLPFSRSPEEVIEHQITYRYVAAKARMLLMQNRINEMYNLIKINSPNLLQQLQKPPGLQ